MKNKFKIRILISLTVIFVITTNFVGVFATTNVFINERNQDRSSPLPTSPSNALAISGNTPYHSSGYYLAAGTAGYVKITATQNYYFSVFTEGSVDTYIEVYSNVACTSSYLVTSNDDSGHGLNAMVYCYITSGSTYYIKIRGCYNTTYGNYSLVVHRGMPTSLSEKGDMFSIYNNSTYQYYNNCYTYALGFAANPVTGNMFDFRGMDPGEMSGNGITMSDLSNATTAKSAIEAALTSDCNYFGGDWASIAYNAQPRQGYYKVALVLDPGEDYHWYRELYNGQWGHKPGISTAKLTDNSDYIIYDPYSCNRGGYTDFLGWYEIKTITVSTNYLDDTMVQSERYNVKLDLKIEDFKRIVPGTLYEDVLGFLGKAHEYKGCGKVAEVYKTSDGYRVAIYYSNKAVDQIRVLYDDETYDIIVQ